jgi:hypothetical protein
MFPMTIQQQIKAYLAAQPEPKRGEMQKLHLLTRRVLSKPKLWFFDGTDSNGKVVANPTIGYGSRIIRYANGTSKEFFQIGLSANKTGISVHILGINDKSALAKQFGKTLGKASVSGYCIRFKTLNDINIGVLEKALRFGVGAQGD